MQIDTDSIAQQCINAINDKINNLKQLNIIVIGKSGVTVCLEVTLLIPV